ncbi:MAG: flippase-like domain-containing protein [Proteobacteria bacterium]|nr:flippase-like domain-containing protein [Pseudomonadota bacterium]MDA1023707.1 flippase-like domain-containing protein [Pseudomonadota bacterium]
MTKVLSYIGLVIGLAVMTGLIVWQGVSEVFELILSSGWPILLVALVWIPTPVLGAITWRLLFEPGKEPGFKDVFMALWIGRAINTLLPVASIGGEVVKARMLILWGHSKPEASASVVVDKTIQVFGVIIWGLIGVALLVHYSVEQELIAYVITGFAVLGAGVAGFVFAQKAGLARVMVNSAHKITKADYFENLKDGAERVDACVRNTYARHGRFALALFWRCLALVLQTAEVWVAAYILGHPITIMEAMFLKAMTSTISDIAFIIPNAYGIQEGAFVVFGAIIGLPADLMLAISLAIRIRELFVDVPGLVIWQHAEGHHFFQKRQLSATEKP